MGTGASLDVREVDPPIGSRKGCTLGRCAREVTVLYRD
jgi:hypothetical protein